MEHQLYPAWLRNDDQTIPTIRTAHADDQQHVASRAEVAAACEEVCTLPPHVPKDQDTDALPTLPHAKEESKVEIGVHPPTPPMEGLWTTVCTAVSMPPNERQIWLEPTALLHLGEDAATISAPNVFVRNRIATHYYDHLTASLSAVVGRPLRIEVVTERSGTGRRP
jgi:hypothetical protein